MAEVETITIGSVDYSVYGLGNADPVGDADDYFAARLGATAWTGATTLAKQQGLVSAFRMLNRAQWSGSQTVSGQDGAFPRDSASCRGTAVPDGTTPDNIALGQFELALALLEDEGIQDNVSQGSNLKRAKAGSAEVEFFRPTIGTGRDLKFPVVVQQLVGCYLAGAGAFNAPFADGTNPANVDERSAFDSCTDDYGLSEGYP